MANRHKPLPAREQAARRADAALARHLNWRAWPLPRQIDFIFQADAAAQLAQHVGPETALAQLHAHAVANRPAAERRRAHLCLRALAAHRPALLSRAELARPLAQLARLYELRRREVADWQPPSKNPFRQLASLVRHLFDEYGDVPTWVVAGWLTPWPGWEPLGHRVAELTCHLGRGESLRSFAGWPGAPLTRRLEHAVRQAPDDATPLRALRHGQLALRGTLPWLEPALQTPLGQALPAADEAFWLGVVDFFATAPFADPRRLPAVCAWIHQRREVGTATEPAQPGFSLRGRTVESVLAAAERWELAERRAERDLGQPDWPGLAVPDFSSSDGVAAIRQLRSRAALKAEGQALGHCVATYAESCIRGRCGIFSLTLFGERVLTIEVSAQRFVVQVRGRHNRRLTDDERHWLVLWLGQANLAFRKGM